VLELDLTEFCKVQAIILIF